MRHNITGIEPSANNVEQLPYGEIDEGCRKDITYKTFFVMGKYAEDDSACRNCKETRGKIKFSETGSWHTVDFYFKVTMAYRAGEIYFVVSFLRGSKPFLPCFILKQCHPASTSASINLFINRTSKSY